MSEEITSLDRVVVRGKYLVYERDPSIRFRMRGMAFPVPHPETSYHQDGWISVLKQLRQASSELNTLRLYRISHPDEMDGFYQAAAQLGFYLLVPLTSAQGSGVLPRDKVAPHCYRPQLYEYGVEMIDFVMNHPNIVGGIIGNEVLNSLRDWPSAPCLLAYARDLKRYAPDFPLMYTTQHDGITVEVTPARTAKLLVDYLTCHGGDDEGTAGFAKIDLFGINIESWCSSRQTFEENEDGSMGSYLDVYKYLQNTTIPVIFSELGCGQNYFDRDNGLGTPLEGTVGLKAREWNQIHVVETEMVDTFSGYLAYAYDGPVNFQMTTGGPWDGVHPLEFNLDMTNYLHQLSQTSNTTLYATSDSSISAQPSCDDIITILKDCCNLELLDVDSVPSYYGYSNESWPEEFIEFLPGGEHSKNGVSYCIFIALLLSLVTFLYYIHRRCGKSERCAESGGEKEGIQDGRKKRYSTFA